MSDMSDTTDVLDRIKPIERPTVRLPKAIAYALAIYCKEQRYTATATITSALARLLPTKYLRQGRKAAAQE